ncbi:MAG: ParB N-terminal domain-containing protein [Gammaproteobacteria bacterium]|nr:ParB N-terminal domain-containing protein [Gammaproteobacteria bacterium]
MGMEIKQDVNKKGAFLVACEKIGTKYEIYRFVDPKTEEQIVASLEKNGQLTPAIVCEEQGQYEILDGLKRLRACRRLKKALEVKVIPGGKGAGKATMLRLNLERKGLNPLEEGLIVLAMRDGDGLNQVQIAEMVHKHKSWVCRRLALVQHLDEGVTSHMRLGLIGATVGRELAKLPRGNQEAVMARVEEHDLSSREVERLVTALNKTKDYNEANVGSLITEILEERPRHAKEEAPEKKTDGRGPDLRRLLGGMRHKCMEVVAFMEERAGGWRPGTTPGMRHRVNEAIDAARLAVRMLMEEDEDE